MSGKAKVDFSEMEGHSYLFMAIEYNIKKITRTEDGIYIVETDKRTIKCSAGELERDFLPIMDHQDKQTQSLTVAKFTEQDEQMKGLSTALMDNIRKVQSDPKYIDQARAINETAGQLIDLARTQIEMLRLVKGLK